MGGVEVNFHLLKIINIRIPGKKKPPEGVVLSFVWGDNNLKSLLFLVVVPGCLGVAVWV